MKKDDFIKVKVEKLIEWNEPNGEGCICVRNQYNF